MSDNNLQEALQAISARLDNIIAEAIGENLARQRGDIHAAALALQDIAEVFKVAVAAAYGAVLQLEGWDVGPADDFVVCVHLARCAVRLWVADLD